MNAQQLREHVQWLTKYAIQEQLVHGTDPQQLLDRAAVLARETGMDNRDAFRTAARELRTPPCGMEAIYIVGSCALPRGHSGDHQTARGTQFTRCHECEAHGCERYARWRGPDGARVCDGHFMHGTGEGTPVGLLDFTSAPANPKALTPATFREQLDALLSGGTVR